MSVPTFSTYQLGRWLLLASLLIMAACTPETVMQDTSQQASTIVQPTIIATLPLENTPTVIVPSATPVVTQSSISTEMLVAATATEPSVPTETAVETATEPTSLPATTPILLAGQMPMRTLEAETTTFSFEGGEGTQYAFSELGRVVGVLPNDDLLYLTNDGLSALDLKQRTLQPIMANPRLPIIAPRNSDRMLVPTDSPDKQFPIWSIKHDGSEPILMGTTSGYFPFYSATEAGKVLLIEQGHLVLAWLDGKIIHKQALVNLEKQLEIHWSAHELSEAPGKGSATPWIDLEISPDGNWIALFDGYQGKFWLTKLDGSLVQEIQLNSNLPALWQNGTGPYIDFMGWNQKSSMLAYQEGFWSDEVNYPPSMFKIIDIHTLNTFEIAVSESIGDKLIWSPNGELVAFTTTNPITGSKLFISNPDGTNQHVLAENQFMDLFWIPSMNIPIYGCWTAQRTSQGICQATLQR